MKVILLKESDNFRHKEELKLVSLRQFINLVETYDYPIALCPRSMAREWGYTDYETILILEDTE